jgi:hypothetical protein
MKSSSITILCITFLAFIVGYKKDDISQLMQSVNEDSVEIESSENPEPLTTKASPKEIAPKAPINNPPMAKPNPPALRQPITRKPKTVSEMVEPRPATRTNTEPRSVRSYKETFKQAMDSVRAGSVRDQQLQKRNLYFEKLSEQLNELKGTNAKSPTGEELPPGEIPEDEDLDTEEPIDEFEGIDEKQIMSEIEQILEEEGL